jgi:hypothetical protein
MTMTGLKTPIAVAAVLCLFALSATSASATFRSGNGGTSGKSADTKLVVTIGSSEVLTCEGGKDTWKVRKAGENEGEGQEATKEGGHLIVLHEFTKCSATEFIPVAGFKCQVELKQTGKETKQGLFDVEKECILGLVSPARLVCSVTISTTVESKNVALPGVILSSVSKISKNTTSSGKVSGIFQENSCGFPHGTKDVTWEETSTEKELQLV